MKKRLLGFEEAHTWLLCLVYLPVPEFVVLMIFKEGIICDIIAILMVVELVAAILIYMIWHRCPDCGRVIAQFHVHKDCDCHYCGCYLLQEEVILKEIASEQVVKEVSDATTDDIQMRELV